MEDLIPIYSFLIGAAPMFAACIVGIAMAGVYWSRARKPALLVLIACVMQVLLILAQALVSGWLVPHLMHGGTFSTTQLFFTFWAVTSSLLHATALGLMIWAAFTGRRELAPTPR